MGKATLTMTGTGWRLNDRPGRWTGRERLWRLLMPTIRRRATWSPSLTTTRLLPSPVPTITLTCSRRSRTIPARGRWLTTNIMKRNRKLRQGWRQARSTICATVWGGLRVTVCITGRALSSRRPGNMTVADVFLRFRSITAPIPSSMATTPSTDCWKRLITPIPSGDGTPGKKNGIC